jgi:uncharacterized protein YnzC (UPF0291/DUF896 family)
MDFQETVKRLNELYHKSKGAGLTEAETAERDRLRREYLAVIRGQVQSSLSRVEIVDAEGNRVAPRHRAAELGHQSCNHDHGHNHNHDHNHEHGCCDHPGCKGRH